MTKLSIHRAHALFGVACAALLATAACENPVETRPEGISIVSGNGVSDTVFAALSQPLVVEVRDSAGRRVQGVTVRFRSSGTQRGDMMVPTLYMSATTPDEYRDLVEAVTDGTGRAAVRVRLGIVATDAQVAITVPTLGYSAQAAFTVQHGAAVRTVVMPQDTAVYVGGSYALRAATEDRFGNQGPATVGALTSSAPATASVSAGAVTGQALGRTGIAVTVGSAQQTVFVSVVPQGTLAAARGDGIYMFGVDGSGYRRVAAAGSARSPRWFPDGQRLVFSMGTLGTGMISDLNGNTRPLVQGSQLLAELWPHPSRDGQWVYFGGYSGGLLRGYPYRVRPDGTGLQLVPGFAPDDFTQAHPTASPTGDRVAYFREEGHSRNVTLRVLDMQTGTVLLRDLQGHAPEWSHGDSIAYLDTQGGDWGPIRLMSSAGQGRRQLGTGTMYHFGFDWSPNDEWIVARDVESQRLEVIRVATGQRIPLPYSRDLYEPAWKP